MTQPVIYVLLVVLLPTSFTVFTFVYDLKQLGRAANETKISSANLTDGSIQLTMDLPPSSMFHSLDLASATCTTFDRNHKATSKLSVTRIDNMPLETIAVEMNVELLTGWHGASKGMAETTSCAVRFRIGVYLLTFCLSIHPSVF